MWRSILLDEPFVACASSAILLHADHLDDLASSRDQFAEPLRLLRGDRPRLRTDFLGEDGDDLRVDRVGLGELAQGAGEVSDLARIDDGEW